MPCAPVRHVIARTGKFRAGPRGSPGLPSDDTNLESPAGVLQVDVTSLPQPLKFSTDLSLSHPQFARQVLGADWST